ncbi:protein transport protein Sec16B-like, partial [Diaphorina citri]
QLNSLSLQSQDEDKVLHRLRKLLLNGSKHKALRWAIENQEWVSALFIASSMDEATYMSVCSMYIQSIPKNDPLRTCLQVQFGLDLDYQYSDDWGVHLAAILNNAQDASLILRFANILGGVKDICGQHFCYISARIHPDSSTNRN